MSLYPTDLLEDLNKKNDNSSRNEDHPPVPKPRTLKREKTDEHSFETVSRPIQSPPSYEHSQNLAASSPLSFSTRNTYPKQSEIPPPPPAAPIETSPSQSDLQKFLDSTEITQPLSNNDIKLAVTNKVKEKTTWSKEPLQKFAVVDSEDSVSYRITILSKTVNREIIYAETPMKSEYQRYPSGETPKIWDFKNELHMLKVDLNGCFVLPKKKTTTSDQHQEENFFEYGNSYKCSDCNGERFLKCRKCRATGKRICSDCDGKRRVLKDGYMVTCQTCGGKGDYKCTICDATGSIECSRCDCQGQVFSYPKLKVKLSVDKKCEGVLDKSVKKLKPSKLVDENLKGSRFITKSSKLSITKLKGPNDGNYCKNLASYFSTSILENKPNEHNLQKLNQVHEVIDRIIRQKREETKKMNKKFDKSKKAAALCWQQLILERIPTCQVEYNVGKGKSLWLVVYGNDMKVHCDDSWPGSLKKKLFGGK